LYIFAFETANFSCSAAIINADTPYHLKVLAFEKEESPYSQGRQLLPLLQTILKKAGLTFKDMHAIAVTTGPGSFTGVRIGLATALGLRLATGLPVIGISSFEVAAALIASHNTYNANTHNTYSYPIFVILESRRQDQYCQLFDASGKALKPAVALFMEEMKTYVPGPVIVAGNGRVPASLQLMHTATPATPPMFDARDVARYASSIILHHRVDQYPLAPFYLRPPDISKPKR
jgi:tRNA threonylcarbamoyladenosine biosynthesis protein TsaB